MCRFWSHRAGDSVSVDLELDPRICMFWDLSQEILMHILFGGTTALIIHPHVIFQVGDEDKKRIKWEAQSCSGSPSTAELGLELRPWDFWAKVSHGLQLGELSKVHQRTGIHWDPCFKCLLFFLRPASASS